MVEWREINHRWGKIDHQILIYRTDYTTFLQSNQGEALNIINSVGIAYHQHIVLYLIKPQEDAR